MISLFQLPVVAGVWLWFAAVRFLISFAEVQAIPFASSEDFRAFLFRKGRLQAR